jgi:hypothetical protein
MKRVVIVNAHWLFQLYNGPRWVYIDGERSLTTYHA